MANNLLPSDREPGVVYQKLPSPSQVLLPAGTAEVAFVGKSKTTKTITQESVTRGSPEPTHGTSTSDAATYGTSTSDTSPATSASSGQTLIININGDGAKTIILSTDATGNLVASDIQTKVRALTATTAYNQPAYANFTAVYTSVYTLTSGQPGPNSTVVVSGGSAATALKLGTGHGGTELTGTGPALSASGQTLTLNLDADGAQTVTLSADSSGALVASDIQTKVRALTASTSSNQFAFNNFTASFNPNTDSYVLSSGTVGTNSSIVISGGSAAALLKLGLAQSGTEAVGTGSTQDALANNPASFIDSISDSNGVNYFQGVDYLFVAPNLVDWHSGGNRPAAGVVYFSTYDIPKTSTDYGVQVMYSLNDASNLYGDPTNPANELATAAYFFFLNGGVKLTAVQTQGTDITSFLAATDLLGTVNTDVMVVLQANTSGFESLFQDIKARVFQLSQPLEQAERMAFLAPAIGTSLSQYQALAQSLAYERIVVTAPSSCLATLGSTQYTLPAYFLNAAISGLLANPDTSVSEPLTRKSLAGFDDVGAKYLRSQAQAFIAAGVLLVQNNNSNIQILQGLTTDRTSVENSEISLVRIEDFFGKQLSAVLDAIYTGTRLDGTALASVRTTITSVINNFISQGVLVAFQSLSVTQNKDTPTAIDVFVRIQPVYPLNFITVQFTLGLL